MRQLTKAESKLANEAFADCKVEGSGLGRVDRPLFHAGFIAGLDHAQVKIEALEAKLLAWEQYNDGLITRRDLAFRLMAEVIK